MRYRSVAFFLLFSAFTHAAPFVNYRGILNAASYSLPGLPNASIARGSIFSIFGKDIGPAGLAQQDSFPLKTTLAGVAIEVRQGNTTVAAIPIAVTPGQINAIMPSNAPLGNVSIKVTYNGSASNYSSTTVVPVSFGIFAVNSAGSGPGIVQNVNSETDRPINSLRKPARRGQAIILWGTGLGAVANDAAAPTPGDLATQVEVYVGGKLAPTLYKGRSPCCSGLDQIVVNVPSDAPFGCYVPVQVRLAGSVTSNSVTMAISDGSTCSDAHSPASISLVNGGNRGLLMFARYVTREDVDFKAARDYTNDVFLGSFQTEIGGEFAFNPLLSLPPSGTCTTYARSSGIQNASSLGFLAQIPSTGTDLDAGAALQVASSAVARSSGLKKVYAASVRSSTGGAAPDLLKPGSRVTVVGAGGSNVGVFTADVAAPPAFDFNGRASLNGVSRATGLSLSWPSTAGTVLITGINFDHPSNATAMFLCAALGTSGSFTVPAYILQTVPGSRATVGSSIGYVMAGAMPPGTSFTAPSLNAGYVTTVSWAAKSVFFK